jgi:pimeloyl-ACP methyl ester carboxylesterase
MELRTARRLFHRRVPRARLIVAATAFLALCLPAAALAEANFLGTWEPNTGVAWTITSQSGGNCEGVSADSGFAFTGCHVNGNDYEFTVSSGGYVSYNHGTIEGNSLTGVFEDPSEHPYTAARVGGATTVNGKIVDGRGAIAAGVPVKLSGTSSEGEAISLATTTGSNGLYSFEVKPGEYSVEASGDPKKQVGGSLEVTSVGDVPECSGTAKEATCKLDPLKVGESGHANFTYTACTATDRTQNNEQLTGCPIIFIPGILGSRITCGSKELFFPLTGISFSEMQLQSNGETNAPGPCNGDAGVPEGEAGVLTNVGPVDAYGSMLAFLKKIALNGVYPFPYDWRKSVSIATTQLNTLVEKVLSETHAKHVVLVAHSMGGLVTQNYIDNSSYAAHVNRAVTIGTPYNGAPKSIIALLNGYANEFSLEKLDLLFGGPDNVQKAARNYTGLFWLYPSTAYGPWLKIDGPGYPSSFLGGNAIDPWVSSLGGNPSLLDSAAAGHTALDGFQTNGVDYEAVIGVGLPTITKLTIAVNELEPEQLVTANYGSGDGTVPAVSQTQGDFPGNGTTVPLHYVCGVEHAGEPGNAGVQERIEEFVLRGLPVVGSGPPACPYSGKEIDLYHVAIENHGTPLPIADLSSSSLPAGALTIGQAVAAGKIQVEELGGHTLITTNEREPVTLAIAGQGVTARVRSVSSTGEGKPSYYGPLTGTITIAANGSVRKGAKKLRAHGAGHAPSAIAHVSRRGRKYLVRLSAHGSSGVAGIYTRIGKGARKRYSHPLLLTRAQLKALRFAAVDRLGDWERPRRVRL